MTRVARAALVLLILSLIALAIWTGYSTLSRRRYRQIRSQIVAPLAPPEGFTRAEGPRPFDFPADHGPHPDFQTEWWYYTGNLHTAEGRRFGYQLTFFRRGLIPPPQRESRNSSWAADQVYMAHFALTDVDFNRHVAFERFSRGAAGLAGAESRPFAVWLEDWRIEQLGDDPGSIRMRAAEADVAIDIRLVDQKKPILQGQKGYSQKGPNLGNASYYYSQTRLHTSGTVRLDEEDFAVDGWSWMDHEFSTGALASDHVGWDWFALQLDDMTELMVFQIRRTDGTLDSNSGGTYVAADATARRLNIGDFTLEVEDTWRSPRSGASYPSGWTVTVPSEGLTLEVEPLVRDQELNLSYAYWEGALHIQGSRRGAAVKGVGYVELTGYADSMQEQF